MSKESLCDFKLVGGTMKLSERPSSSQSSIFKKRYMSRFSSRPSSALPRLCSTEKSQDELTLIKSDKRPYSADFVMPNLISGKSKDTLTDGSFEIPVDFNLPSSNLFKELLEENIESWQEGKPNISLNTEEQNEKIQNGNPYTISKNIESNHTIFLNSATNSVSYKSSKEEISESKERNEIKNEDNESFEILNENSKDILSKENLEKYTLTPGLTSKPPLPKKSEKNSTFPIISEGTGQIHNNAIYEYFSIKYNFDNIQNNSNYDPGEKLIADETPPNTYVENNNNIDQNKSETNKSHEATSQCIKTIEVFEEPSLEDDFDINSTLKDWLNDIEGNIVDEKESETDKYLKEVKEQCKNTKDNSNLPALSEINLDDLFNFHDNNENQKEICNNFPKLNEDHSKDKHKKNVSMNTTKTKSPSKKLTTPHKIAAEKHVTNKSGRENKTFSKGKFTAIPIKPQNLNDSPRLQECTMEENIDTWISKERSKQKNKKTEFTELITCVEDLKKTTEINKDLNVKILPNGNKQENYDDLQTIIEELEYQDKTSQKNIKEIKKIITSEISNSLILNEGEENLKFKKKMSEESNVDYTIEPELLDMEGQFGKNCCKFNHSLENTCGDSPKSAGCNGLHSYKELLSYLDEVDKSCTKTLEVAKERAHTASKLVLESTSLFDTIPKVEDLMTHTSEQLASYIIDLTLRVKDKTSCIGLLQNELSSLRDKILNQTKQAESTLRQKLKEQKEETERITKRHQKFIDQLMEEKKTLARRCEELVEEMKSLEDKYVSNMKAIEHRHQVELQKVKDMQSASEKLRRERWIEGRTQKIKEMAVKSIEPEVERMEKRHQEEISNLRAIHKREIEELELRAARKLQEHSENLREQLIKDREKALEHERDVMRLRYEKLVESEERNYQEQRRRLLADHSNRIAECEEREAQAISEKEKAIKQAQEEYEEKLQAASRRHTNEIRLVNETAVIEMENWKNLFRKQQTALLLEKETSIRRECKKERDKEIELVIERLENESDKAKSQLEQTAENRIKRIKEKYEFEIKDLEMLEKDAQNKYCEARSKLLEYEDVILTLRTSIKQLENQFAQENLKRSKLESEREEIRETIRKEYEDKMQSLENEVEELRTSADKQVEQLYSRVRVSLARKDELLTELTSDHKALKEKCTYLESMIEQQRKEFMIK